MNHENQTTKSHEPGITKRHKGSADESGMLLPLKRLLANALSVTSLKRGVNEKYQHGSVVSHYMDTTDEDRKSDAADLNQRHRRH